MFLIPPPPSRRVMEQKSWLNILQLSLLPTDLHDQFSGRNERSSHPFLLTLFYFGALRSSVPQAETGILPNFGINVSKLCCHLFESFALLRNSRQTSGLWTSLQILGTKLCTSGEILICSLFICPLASSWKGSCSVSDFHWHFGYLGRCWCLSLL